MKFIKIIFAVLLLFVMGAGLYSVLAPEAALAPFVETEEDATSTTPVKVETVSSGEAVGSLATTSTPTPTTAQAKALEMVGLDSTDLSFSSGEIACFKEVLGETRVSEIVGGAVPGAVELYKAKDCLGR